MKIIFMLAFVLIITIPTISAAPLADKTGFKFSFPASLDDNFFVVEGTTNFDMKRMDFDSENREITFEIQSSLDDNLAEIIIPRTLLRGDDLTFMITSTSTSVMQEGEPSSITLQVIPKIIHYDSENVFTTLEFNGSGTHYLTISESSYQNVQDVDKSNDEIKEDIDESTGGGCLTVSYTHLTLPTKA